MRIRASRLALTAAAATALVTTAAAPAYADDGLACGDVVTTDVKLTADLVGCDGPGLVVGAPGITIDLGGHVLAGTGWGTAGIDNYAAHDDVVVRRGTIRGFVQGVYLHRSDGSRVERVTVTDNANGINLENSADVTIDRVRADGNWFQGMSITFGERVVVHRSTANGNEHGGITDRYSYDNAYDRNELNGNDFYGLTLDGAVDVVVERNVASGNAVDGIQVGFQTETALLDRNDTTGNGEVGIRVDEPGNTLVRNRAHDNGVAGISAPEGTVDGGGNRGTGNGADDCTGVACR